MLTLNTPALCAVAQIHSQSLWGTCTATTLSKRGGRYAAVGIFRSRVRRGDRGHADIGVHLLP